ncbi:REP-associated tyrosine transposase [Aeoliella sp. SH292]|uniref:REP-associated tyrosine transposase n=1 Tax=Aeoliella sp. SH292 TaxID=3454464 RepID=UPI003F9AFBE0
MSDFRRYYVAGATYFFTVVSYRRRPILTTEPGRRLLREAIEKVRSSHSFDLVANVLLPDHWHLVMQLPSADADYSLRMRRIKEEFTESWLAEGLPEARVTTSQRERHERGVWQPRFWEHLVTDEEDLERCVDYIHWNPRKHALVDRVQDYPWSSFHRFVEQGQYEREWGGQVPQSLDIDRDWGEPT